jgi:hypothetical protein
MGSSEDGVNIKYPSSPDDWIKWTRRWWESMMEVPKESNPIADPDGTYFKSFKQPADSENIWFLAGNLGGETTREIDVKKGKAIFMPLVNYIGCENPGYGKSNLFLGAGDPKLESEAESDIKKSKVIPNYDGIKEKIREQVKTPLWNLKFAEPPVMGDRSGEAKCLSNGIWIFTEPLLNVGQTATITIHAENDEFQSNVTYKINIVP